MKKVRYILFISMIVILGMNVFSQEKNLLTGNANLLNKEELLFFIENKGQWPDDVYYLCRMRNVDIWITKNGMNFTYFKIADNLAIKYEEINKFIDYADNSLNDNIIRGQRVLFELLHCNTNAILKPEKKLDGYYNYFIDNDHTKHYTNIGLYKEVTIKNVYKGIDMHYSFDNGHLRYDFIAEPYADVSQIKFNFKGSDDVYINEKGQLVFTTCFGETQMANLKVYQDDNSIINSNFVKEDNYWKIAIGNYQKEKPLIIDPIIFSTYVGGNSNDIANDIKTDNNGDVYIAGWTISSNYDVTPGVFQTVYTGNADAFVTKLNSTGTALVYSTFIGSSAGLDAANAIVIGSNNNVFITGATVSNTFPTTSSAFQTTYEGGGDAFVTKLNSTGTALLYSTFLGGSSDDWANAIFVDANGNAYVTGKTKSANFDIVTGGFQTTFAGGAYDAFVTKLNATGGSLLFSTYLGGSGMDEARGIIVNGSGNAFVTGYTNSNNFPTTTGAYQTAIGGDNDVFVTKLNTTGSALSYSTYIGGSADDQAYDIILDITGSTIITGKTNSTNYDITIGAYQTTNAGDYDAFVTKVSSMGSSLNFSTYLGGSGVDEAYGIVMDASSNIYVTGKTNSADFDTTTAAYRTTAIGNYDIFLTKLNSTATALIYSTYLGSVAYDEALNLAIDNTSSLYITGKTSASNFFTTPGAFQSINEGAIDIFVVKFCCVSVYLTSAPGTNNQSICFNNPITEIIYNFTGGTNAIFTGIPAGVTANFNSAGNISIFGTPLQIGNYNYTITLTGGCENYTVSGNITVYPEDSIFLTSGANTNNQTVCINENITEISYGFVGGATSALFLGLPAGVIGDYNGSNFVISGAPNQAGVFNYSVILFGTCVNDTAYGVIVVNTVDTSITFTNNTLFANQNGAVYQWVSCPDYAPLIGQTNQLFVPSNSGNYAVIITYNNCIDTSQCYTISLTGVDYVKNNSLFSISPNPSNGYFVIDYSGNEIEQLVMINFLGELVSELELKPGKNVFSFDLPRGVYLLKLSKNNHIVKLIIK